MEPLYLKNRKSFIYFDKCKINISNNQWCVNSNPIPLATYAAIFLGPGSSITHDAMRLASEYKIGIYFTSQNIGRIYSSSSAFFNSKTKNFMNQIAKFNDDKHKVFTSNSFMRIRFKDWKDCNSIKEIRIEEAHRMKSLYHRLSEQHGVNWSGRVISSKFDDLNKINKILTITNTICYGLADASLATMGLNPYLGFIHRGRGKSLVYDVADIIKTDITIPMCFKNHNLIKDHVEIKKICYDEFENKKVIETVEGIILSIIQGLK